MTNHLIHHSEDIWLHTSETKFHWNRCPVSSVGRAVVCWAEGCGFKPLLDQHSGSLNNWEESAAFVTFDICKWLDFLIFSDRTNTHRSWLTALSLTWLMWVVKRPTRLLEKSRGCRPCCCYQPFLGWVGYLFQTHLRQGLILEMGAYLKGWGAGEKEGYLI